MTSGNGDWFDRGGYPWISDQRDGSFRNPILFADYSDPDVIRHGDDFFLTASSFNCTPALPILHSHDLVNWSIIGHAMKNLPANRFSQVQPGCGVWAPAMHFHDGKFYIFFSMPDEGIYRVTSDHPAGEWSPPYLVQEGKGLIDPCPLWDDDGSAYLIHAYAFSRSGVKHRLRVRPMAADGSRLLGPGKIVFEDPHRHPTVEGPKFHKRNGFYYIFAPAGGVADGWQLALRSRDVLGPYEEKIVLERGSTPINGPHQGALVDSPDGASWFVHFQEHLPYGRIVHLQPARWENDWPIMGIDRDGNGIGEPVNMFRKPVIKAAPPPAPLQTSDDFDQAKLGFQWQWQANHASRWYSLTARPHWLRLFTQPLIGNNVARAPHVVAQKFPALEFVVDARIDSSHLNEHHQAGLIVLGREHAALAVSLKNGSRSIALLVNGQEKFVAKIDSATVELRVQIERGGKCTFSYAEESAHFELLPLTFQSREGKWIGAKVGLFSVCTDNASPNSYADFDYFRFSPSTSTLRVNADSLSLRIAQETVQAWRSKKRPVNLANTKTSRTP